MPHSIDAGNPAALISYRRSDSQSLTERLAERLVEAFGDRSVFIDTEDIPIGIKFDEHIKASLRSCTVVLACIGRNWIGKRASTGDSRLSEEGDFVRRELEWAVEHGIPVVPVLLDGATMPRKNELPESVQFITNLNAVHVRPGSDFLFTSYRLIAYLQDNHGFPKPHEHFPYEYVLCPVAIVATILGIVNSVTLTIGVSSPQYVHMNPLDTSGWVSLIVMGEIFGPLLLGAGPIGIFIAKRWCCLRRDRQRRPSFLGRLEAERQKEPRSMLGFVLGLSAIGWGVISGIPAIVFSLQGIYQIRKTPSRYRGRRYSYLGITIAIFGILISYQVQKEVYSIANGFRALDRAMELAESGDYDSAEASVMEACRRLPYLIKPYLVAGEILIANEQYSDATEALSIAIEDLETRRETKFGGPLPSSSPQLIDQLVQEQKVLIEAYELRASAFRAIGEESSAKADEDSIELLQKEIRIQDRMGRLGISR